MESPAKPPDVGLMTPAAMPFRQGSNLWGRNPCREAGFFVAQKGTHVEQVYMLATAWLALAVLAAVLASHLRISIALVEICVGVAAAFAVGPDVLGANLEWLRVIASVGAVLLTFLAGAELDPAAMKTKLREVVVVGLFGFVAPILGCAALARFVLGWGVSASWLAGIALSTTSMAVVYAVMLETGFNKTEFGKGILGACFVNDLGTVIVLGLLFAPFTYRTVLFAGVCVGVLVLLPPITSRLIARYGNRTAAIRTKWILLVLCGLGGLALWAGSEAVLPAYVAGMAIAKTVGRDSFYIRRLRTLTVGFLTPFYFLRAGSLVSLSALASAPLVFLALLTGKVASKIFGLYPVIGLFRRDGKERWYYTLLMSTGLTFGTISALYGLSHGIVTPEQYSFLVAVIIASAVVPTMIANALFLPRHLLPSAGVESGGGGETGAELVDA
jgi:glutathione-regulated potassium-efflux system ancillary protein KefC